MRLDRLDLTRYGRFTDKSLNFPRPAPGAPDLHIVFGPNEAGKSTLFSGWLDLLFGIPLRSRYDFLHPAASLQIGAALSQDGKSLEVKRVKRKIGSLLDQNDLALPETVLQSALGGLSREGYGAMFSLDDDTLERGGESILANRGDLGEMLFSASAGLSNLSPQLDKIRATLDGFHRKGGRSGWLHEAKAELKTLDAERKSLDSSSAAIQKLSSAAALAETALNTARIAAATGQAEFDRVQALEASLPLLGRLAALQSSLAPLMHLPQTGEHHHGAFAQIEAAKLDLASRIRARDLSQQALLEELRDLSLDADVLAQSQAIAATEALRAEHDSAQKDLPRRITARDEAAAVVRALLHQLGQTGKEASAVVIAAPQLSMLRTLIAARSGLTARLEATQEEWEKAKSHLAREKLRLGELGAADEEESLQALLSRLRVQDPDAARKRALRNHDSAQDAWEHAQATLAPWGGTAAELAALAVPNDETLTIWADDLAQAGAEAKAANAECQDLNTRYEHLQADMQARAHHEAAAGVSLAQAALARSQREALWAAHLQQLSPETATAFERALREDDQITTLLGDAASVARAQAEDAAALAILHEKKAANAARLRAAEHARAASLAKIATACARIGLEESDLSALRRWLALRQTALQLWQTATLAARDLAQAQSDWNTACESLRQATGVAEAEGAALGYDSLHSLATARVEAAARRREARSYLAGLADDLTLRVEAKEKALSDWQAWLTRWQEAQAQTILAHYPPDHQGLNALLDGMGELDAAAQTLASLDDRILKMGQNRDRFQQAKAEVLAALQAPEQSPWHDILARLRRAEDSARDHDTLSRQLMIDQKAAQADERMKAGLIADEAALAQAVGYIDSDPRFAPSLAEHLAQTRLAATLRQDIKALEDELRGRPLPAPQETAEDIRENLARLRATQQMLRDTADASLQEHLAAKSALDAVGGDDQLARIAAQRMALSLEITEKSKAHLAQRLGLIAFEHGLRRYREHHRSDMLQHASEAFSALSLGAYPTLAAQADGGQEVLLAQARDGGAKLAVDMSKGTRFQLYLALRMAGYYELAKSRPSVPFIADDIMETFDDGRSGAAFTLLAQMAQVGQVIYLTHHQHLCDMAQNLCPGVNIIDLRQA